MPLFANIHFYIRCNGPIFIAHWGIPSSDGIPNGVAEFFFFFLLPPPKMAFPEAKRNEGNLVLTWYFRKTL